MIDPNVQELLVGANEIQSFKRLKMKQFDKNLREFRISLIEDGELTVIPSGYVAKFQATKPDKTIVLDNCTIVDNVVIYKPKEQLSTVAGTVECEIGFYIPDPEGNTNEDGLIQSVTFEILVEKSAMDRNAVISSNEFNTLTIMINTITGLIVEANEALSQIEGVIESEEGRVIAENGRVDAEEIRVQKDLTRPDYIYLTQAQYDALPLIEKEDINKIYEITDDDGELPNELEALILDTQNAATAAWAAASASLPDVGTAGTYTKVTTDSKGRVTNGSTPTNIGDLGITNVYNKTEIDNKTGDLSTLATIEKNNLVGAINENTSQLAENALVHGDLSQLPTNTKDNLVNVWVKNYNRINPEDYGAIMDGAADDTDELQTAINAAITKKKELFLPPQANIKVTGALSVNGNIKIIGGGRYNSYILCVGCDGLNITNGLTSVTMEGFSIAQAVRHTTTPNTKKGIIINGATGSRPYNHIYRDIYIDGFETSIEANWIWASLFNNVHTNYGRKGLVVKGLSVNNKIDGNSEFSVDGSSGSRGIFLGDGVNELEGWWINSPLVFGAEIGIQGIGASHIYINNPILDFCKVNGILIGDNGTDFGGNWDISGGYIAMTGSGGEAVIKDTNSIVNSMNRGSHIRGTSQLTYPGATCSYGIWMQGAESKNAIISDNTISGFAVNDIYAPNGDNTVIGNKCLSSGITNINAVGNVANNGKAIVYYRRTANYTTRGMQKDTYDEAMPTTGTYNAGDICWKVNPFENGTAGSRYILHGWRRLSTGSAHVLNVDWAEMRMLTGQ
jgi:hypothetical protein